MIIKHRFLQVFILILCTFILYDNVQLDQTVSYEPLPDEDETVFTIGICSMHNSDTAILEQGFSDALYDLFGKSHIKIVHEYFYNNNLAENSCKKLVDKDVDLIFTIGSEALSAASMSTLTIPIVSTDIISFKNALHIPNEVWDGTTERNITGVSSLPNMPALLSLLIEGTPKLESVGLLYSPEDTDSIYQNEIMEYLLSSAGIPWKEYVVRLSESQQNELDNEVETEASVVIKSNLSARSAKEGPNIDIESIVSDISISGINAPESVRSPRASYNWKKDSEHTYIRIENAYEPIPELSDDPSIANKDELNLDELSYLEYENEEDTLEYEQPALSTIMEEVVDECSAIFIASGSMLSDQLPEITRIANKSGVSTIGGDTRIGENTLVSLFTDSYDQGYRAGKIAYRVLIKNIPPSNIRIGDLSSTPYVKLYKKGLSKEIDIDFPKSFHEYSSYTGLYSPGAMTNRLNSSN